jgi:hypothetical protein
VTEDRYLHLCITSLAGLIAADDRTPVPGDRLQWLLDIAYWLLAIVQLWLLAIVYCLLSIVYWLLAIVY